MAWGEYPPEFNPRVHGTYDPARWYGKPDTTFGNVKLGEMAAWIGRRNKGPQATVSAISRSWWRWQHRWYQPLKPSFAGPMQLILGIMTFFYVTNYGKYRQHRLFKYHW